MIKKNVQVNRLRTLVILLTVVIVANSTVYANKQQSPIAESKNTDAEALLVRLKKAVKSQKIEKAKPLSDQIIQTWPSSTYAVDALGEIGYLYALKGDASAGNTLTELYTKYSAQPKLPRAIDRVAQGYILKRKKDVAKARAIYAKAIAKIPDHPNVAWLHGGLIRCQIAQNDFRQVEKSIEILKRNYSKYPELCAIIYALADDYRYLLKHGKAKALYQFVAQNSSDSNLAIKGQRMVACCELRLNSHGAFRRAINTLKNDYSENAFLYAEIFQIAKECVRQIRPLKAIPLYEFIAQNSSDSILVSKSQGQIVVCTSMAGHYREPKQMETLDSDYSRIKGHKDQCVEIYALADQYYISKKLDKAKDLWQYVSQNSSDCDLAFAAQTSVVCCEANLGNYTTAEQVINALTKDYSEHPLLYQYLHILGDDCWNIGKFDMARDIYQYVSQNSSDSDLVIKSLRDVAICKIILGNDSATGQYIDRLLSQYLHHDKLAANLTTLSEYGGRDLINSRLVNLVQDGQKSSVNKQGVMLCIELLNKKAADDSLKRYLALSSKNDVILEDIEEVLSFCEEKEKYSYAVRLCQYYLKHNQAGEDKEEIELRLYTNLLPNSQNPASMLPDLEKYISRNKETYKSLAAKATLLKGRILIFSGDIDKAIAIFEKMNEEFPGALETQEGIYLTGYGYLMQSEFEKSKNILSQLIKKYPSSEFVNKAQKLIERIEEMT